MASDASVICSAVGLIAGLLACARPAAAQVRWDAGLLVGSTERWTAQSAAPHPTPGPSAELHAHLAVLPMLRVGPYGIFDLSPASGARARQVYAAGLRAKVTPPLFSPPWRGWAFAGIGVAEAYSPDPGDRIGMLEFPVGVGIGYRLRGLWELCAELGARVVAAQASIHAGSPGGSGAPAAIRDDFLAVSLSVGVSLGR